MKKQNNAHITAENTGKYINFKLSVGKFDNVLIRLVKPNRKLAYALFIALGGADNGTK